MFQIAVSRSLLIKIELGDNLPKDGRELRLTVDVVFEYSYNHFGYGIKYCMVQDINYQPKELMVKEDI